MLQFTLSTGLLLMVLASVACTEQAETPNVAPANLIVVTAKAGAVDDSTMNSLLRQFRK